MMTRYHPKLRCALGILFFFGLFHQPVLADEAGQILNEIGEAVRTQNYRGVMVYAREGEMHSLQIVHRYQAGREQERLQALTGEAREVLRDNEVVTCILPEEQKVLVDRYDMRGPLSAVAAMSTEFLAPHYNIQLEPDQRLVDRNCKVLSLMPKDAYRYGYRIWVDETTHLPLRIDLLSVEGKTLEQTMFTQVEFPGSIADDALKPEVDPKDFTWVRQAVANTQTAQTAASHWGITQLPPGYKLISHNLRDRGVDNHPEETFLFSDGLATVSAIIKPTGERPSSLQGLSQMGAMHAFGKRQDDYHLAVMGEVPADTVQFIAEQLSLQQEAVTTAQPE